MRVSFWCALVALAPTALAAQQAPQFTAEQAAAGREIFVHVCSVCHNVNLTGSEIAPPLSGAPFASNWGGQSAAKLLAFVTEEMPQTAPGSLDKESYLRVVSYILSFNGVRPGTTELTLTDPGVITVGPK